MPNRENFLQQLKHFGEKNDIPNVSWEGVSLLRFFLDLLRPKRVLEIGCANGFSTIVIADTIEKWGGTLLTTDISAPTFASAKKNFAKANLTNIDMRFGDALSVVSKKDAPFDLVFIDAQKNKTHEFFFLAEKILSEKGMILVDDVRKFPEKMEKFYELIKEKCDTWYFLEIPVEEGDAMVVARRKE